MTRKTKPFTVGFGPLPDQRISDDVVLKMEDAILTGRLMEGDRLPPERELAAMLDVGRSTLREALRVLEMHGVVVTRRGAGADSGSFVTASTPSALATTLRLQAALRRTPLADFTDLRLVLETLAVERAARCRTLEDVAVLRGMVDQMRDASPREFHDLDSAFHVRLAAASGNALVPLLVHAVREAVARELLRVAGWVHDWPDERKRLVEEHESIVAAIEAGDADGAGSAMRGHINRVGSRASESRG